LNPLKKLAGQTATYGLSSVIGRLLSYLLVPLYTRYFLPQEYGVVTEIYAYVAFLVIVLTYGLETAFFRFSKKENDIKVVYSTALISLIISSLIFVSLMFFGSSFIANNLGYGIESRYVEWFAIIVGLDAISSISFAKIRAQEEVVKFTVIRLLGIFTNIGLNLYFIVYKGFGIEYIFVSNLISSSFTVLCLLPEMLKVKFTFNSILWKKMMIYALPLLVAGLAGMTNETVDRVLLKQLLSNTDLASYELGLYGAFYKLSIIMILFIQTFRFAAEPFFFSHYNHNGDRKIYADVMKYFIITMIVIFLTVTIFYDFVIGFLGTAYHDERGFLVVSILLLANLFLGIFFNLSIWYKLTDQTFFGAYLAIFGATVTLTLNFILIPKIGFIGSAWATLVCYFSMVVVSYILGKKHFPIPYQLEKILLYLFTMLVIFFFIYNNYFNLGINSLLLLGFIIFVCLLEKPKNSLKT
jgi:O-antigen/teichoic acid export membrane protein